MYVILAGWALQEVLKINLEISKVEPLRFSCLEDQYNPRLATFSIPGKKHLTNIENSKWNCFLTCLAYHFLKRKYPNNATALQNVSGNEISYGNFLKQLNYTNTGIESSLKKPVKIMQMKTLLKNNKKILDGLQLNIFGWLDGKIYAFELEMNSRKCMYVYLFHFQHSTGQ